MIRPRTRRRISPIPHAAPGNYGFQRARPAREIRQVVFHGISDPRTIQALLEKACEQFAGAQRAFASGDLNPAHLGEHLAALLAEMLRIHPFIDGNHRIAGLVMQAVFRDVTGSMTRRLVQSRRRQRSWRVPLRSRSRR